MSPRFLSLVFVAFAPWWAFAQSVVLPPKPAKSPAAVALPLNDTLRGELTSADPKAPDGTPFDTYRLAVPAKTEVILELRSSDFDAYLTVREADERLISDDDSLGGTDATLTLAAGAARTVDVFANNVAVDGVAFGAYALTTRARVDLADAQVADLLANLPEIRLGSVVNSELNQDDTAGDGHLTELYRLNLAAGDEVLIAADSDDFDIATAVILPNQETLENDDGEGAGTNSRLLLKAATGGAYIVGVTTAFPMQSGRFQLRLEASASPVAPATSLVVGQNRSNELVASDPQEDGRAIDRYEVELSVGQRYRIDLKSRDFDTVLRFRWKSGETLENDDGPGVGTDSVLEVTAIDGGRHVVEVTSLGRGATGAYTLLVTPLGGASNPGAALALTLGTAVTGTLTEDDRRAHDNSFIDTYSASLVAGRRYLATLNSTDFDTFLGVLPGDGTEELLTSDDDGGDGLNSQLFFIPPTSGTYFFRANSAEPNETGAYSLEVRDLGVNLTQPRESGLNLGSATTGALDLSDALVEGQLTDAYTVRLEQGKRYLLSIESNHFDPSLALFRRSPPTLLLEDDDGGEGTDSLAEFAPDQTDTYRLLVQRSAISINGSNATGGSYTVFVRETSGSAQGPAAKPLTINRIIQSALTENSAVEAGGARYVDFGFTPVTGRTYTITARSTEFDTLLELRRSSGVRLDRDDDSAGGTDSRLTWTATDNLPVVVRVGAFNGMAEGAFTLLVSDGSTPVADGTPAAAAEVRVAGALEDGDERLSDQSPVDVYRVMAQAGAPLTVTLNSAAFDAYLIVTNPSGAEERNDDGPNLGTNARVTIPLPVAGEYTIAANTLGASGRGAYELIVQGAAGPVQPGRAALGSVAQLDGQRLPLGQTTLGTLAAGDQTLRSGEFLDRYQIPVEAGDSITVNLSSTDFDSYLMLTLPGGGQLDNDNHGNEAQASQLSVVADRAGEVGVVVTSAKPGETGDYTLTTMAQATPMAQRPAPFHQVQRGDLAEGDAKLTSGEWADYYYFYGEEGTEVTVDLQSTSFDTYLIVVPPGSDHRQQDNDDFEGSARRSLVSWSLPVTGLYKVGVTSFAAGQGGDYTLLVGTTTSLNGVQTFSGNLTEQSPKLTSGEFQQEYFFEGTPNQRVRIEMSSSDFDTYLILEPPQGSGAPQQDNDDFAGDVRRSVIETDLPAAGRYRVRATTFRPGLTGRFDLTITLSDSVGSTTIVENERGGQNNAQDVAALALGETIEGSLDATDRLNESGAYRDQYVFEGTAGQNLRVAVRGSFDTTLTVTAPDGTEWSNDDWENSVAESRVEFVARDTGRYRVAVTSYRAGTTGTYAVTATALASGTVAQPALGAGNGRVFGVFIGLTDYPNNPGDLPNCDLDARYAAEVLTRGGHMQPANGIVLTNAQGTGVAMRDAFRTLAARMSATDTFVFFYSGHGGKSRRNAIEPADPDGFDETLSLYDGDVTDNDFAALLDTIPAETQIVVLDSCFSGGFSKDIISRPGRMGLFSSPDYVTSAVPDKFVAGGYLARFFADGIDGRPVPNGEPADTADEDRDGEISANELCIFVSECYRQVVRRDKSVVRGQISARPSYVETSSNLSYQTLVFDLGSIDPYQGLFRIRR